MKYWAKGGLIGFIVAFLGLWVILFTTGNADVAWKCVTLEGPKACSFFEFTTSFLHWAFVLFFSWVGFFGGAIDSKIIRKIIKKSKFDKKIYLKITSTIVLTLVLVFSAIGLLVFDNWVEIMVYTVIFVVFIILLSWVIGKIKYRN